ncbi:MAG: c-type cytochrome [Opitutales bacterium]|nr:c-type cytochrome [Opitutales bacterium]
MPRFLIFFLFVAVFVTAWTAPHWKPSPADQGVSLEKRAKAIAQSCAACHGTDGRFHSEIPSLAGKPEPVLSALLIAYRNDSIPNATVMPRIAKGYTEEELRAVAAHFATLSATEE